MADAEVPRVSVVIPVRNGAATIGEQLAALAAQILDEPWEVVVADNGSTDASRSVVQRCTGTLDLRCVAASERRGASHARNVGAAAANGEYLLFVDADDRVTPGWLPAMVRALERADAVGGRRRLFWNDRRAREVMSQHVTPALLTLDPGFLSFATSNNCGVRHDVFEALGGFDVSYEVCEDDDFFWRLQLQGFSIVGVEDSVVETRERGTAWQAARRIYHRGRLQARLYCNYGSDGLGRRSFGAMLLTLARSSVLLLPRLRSHYGRRRAVEDFALAAGRIVGSAREHVAYF